MVVDCENSIAGSKQAKVTKVMRGLILFQNMPTERLQKIIAAAGVASRRKAEELITAGRVAVNGQTVTELGTKADPEHDHIRVNGKLLRGAEQHVYILLNKP